LGGGNARSEMDWEQSAICSRWASRSVMVVMCGGLFCGWRGGKHACRDASEEAVVISVDIECRCEVADHV
jgi:hypothetical protein